MKICFLSNFFKTCCFQIEEVLEEGVGDLKYKVPTLVVLNKKDLIKPGEVAKKLEVRYRLTMTSFIAK